MSEPLIKRNADWLRSYAASMWQAMQDDIDAEEFEGDRDDLNHIADDLDKIATAFDDYVNGRILLLELCDRVGVPHPTEKRISSLIANVRAVLDAQPPPVSGDYPNDEAEQAAIDARDAIRDWYRRELTQVVAGWAEPRS